MSLLCLILRRGSVPYLEGGLGPGRAGRLEKHMARCGECRARFERVRAGHLAGGRFGRLGPESPSRFPAFEELWAGRPARRSLWPAIALPALVSVVAGLALILVISNGRSPLRSRAGVVASRDAQPGREFTPLAIREFATNSRSRVVTEGYVHNVYYDEEERTLHIKLSEGPGDKDPFVICEIRDVGGLTIPREGSRVRVFGTARFDSQPGRGWHEVNPVMEIAVLNR
jgi:hypothetical protein